MMTNEMQEFLPHDPPPPPGEPAGAFYGHWSSDPQRGPPSWPPAPQRRTGGSGLRRTALAVFAVACVGAGGGTAWALTTTAISTPSTGSLPAGGSTATVAKIDSAVVDITADTAAGNGEVAGTGMIITSNGQVLTNNHVIDDTV